MKTGNMSGNSRCEKWELAWARPTKPMMDASWRSGTGRLAARVAEFI